MSKTEVIRKLFEEKDVYLSEEILKIVKKEIIDEVVQGKPLEKAVKEKAEKLKRDRFPSFFISPCVLIALKEKEKERFYRHLVN